MYPVWVILWSALAAPTFFSSSFLSSGDIGRIRSSNATEKGIRGSPGLFSSIQALIFGSLCKFQVRKLFATIRFLPFILLPQIVLFTQINQIRDWFGGQKHQGINNIDLERELAQCVKHVKKIGSAEAIDFMRISGRYSLFKELGYRAWRSFSSERMVNEKSNHLQGGSSELQFHRWGKTKKGRSAKTNIFHWILGRYSRLKELGYRAVLFFIVLKQKFPILPLCSSILLCARPFRLLWGLCRFFQW